MQWLVEIGLSNALVAVVLAVVAWGIGKVSRRPAVTHALCLLVLLKLLTPPIIELPLPLPIAQTVADGRSDIAVHTAPIRHRLANEAAQIEQPATAADHSAREFAPSVADQLVFAIPRRDAGNLTASGSASVPVGKTNSLRADLAPVGPAAETAAPKVYDNSIPWARLGPICVVVWIVGMAAWFALQLVLGLRMAVMLRQSAPATLDLSRRAERMALRMGLARSPRLRVVGAAISPMLCGLGSRACIVVPQALLGRLSPDGLDTVLAHELAHFRRKDQWVRLLELVATGLYWWHPVVWWARRRMEFAEEQCCDAHVLQACSARPRVYAEAILEIVDLISEPRARLRPVMSSGIGHAPPLTSRLRDLMEGRCVPTISPLGRRIIIVAGALCLFYHPTFFVTEAPSARAASVARLRAVRPPQTASRVREWKDAQAAPPARETSTIPDIADSLASQAEADTAAQQPWATAISPNGRYQIAVRPGFACELHEVIGGHTRELGADPITCVAFSPDSGTFVTGDPTGAVRLWDSASAAMLETLSQRDGAVHSVVFSPMGDRVVLAGEDGMVEVVNLDSRGEPRFARGMGAPVRCVRFSPDGEQLAVAIDTWRDSSVGSVAVYHVVSQSIVHRWDVDGPIGAVQFQPDGSLLVAEWSGRVVRWLVPEITPAAASSIAKDLVSAASFSSDTRTLEAAMDNGHF